MTVSVKAPTSTTGSIQLNGSDVLTIESDRSVDIDSGTLHVDATNNRVGIGTGSPADLLEISHATTSRMRFSETTNSLTLSVGQWGSKNRIEGSGGSNLIISNYDASNPIAFYTGFGGGNTERMRIDSGGGVFVGKTTTAPTTAGWYLSPGAGNVGLSSGNYFVINYVPGGASTMIDFRTGGVSKGNISQNGTNTAYNTSSDYRLKENVAPMSGSIDRLKQLKPSTWSWTQDGSHGEGFLAHEAQTVVPEAVTGIKDAMRTEEYEITPAVLDDDGNVVTEAVMGTREVPDYQGIDQSKLVPLLTSALQEAITKIEDLETRIQALESA